MRLSRFMSLALRHKPSKAGVTLDEDGWAPLEKFTEGCRKAGFKDVDATMIQEIVDTNKECKFEIHLHEDGCFIRAASGHTVLNKSSAETPKVKGFPERMYYLTDKESLADIGRHGIHPLSSEQNINRVRLSEDVIAGGRNQVSLAVDSEAMADGGYVFMTALEPGFWLVQHVPESFIEKIA